MTPGSGPGRERSGQTRYLEVCDLGSVSKLLVGASYLVAQFYESLGASARIYLTVDPVETKHPRDLPNNTSSWTQRQGTRVTSNVFGSR
jgi:hypothetical protein